jgi:hypothetical protein
MGLRQWPGSACRFAGAHWTDISTNLPDIPANAVKVLWGGALVVGTGLGVLYRAPGQTGWKVLGRNLPRHHHAVPDQACTDCSATSPPTAAASSPTTSGNCCSSDNPPDSTTRWRKPASGPPHARPHLCVKIEATGLDANKISTKTAESGRSRSALEASAKQL